MYNTKLKSNFHGGSMSKLRTLEIFITILILSGTALAAPISYTLSSPNPSTINVGETFTASVYIRNDDSLNSINCKVSSSGKSSNEYTVNPGATMTIPLPSPIIAPSIASTSFFVIVTTYCHSTNDPTDVLKYININFQTIATPEMIAKQTAEADRNSAYDAKFNAKKVIFSVNASIREAQDAINDAKNIGVDVDTAKLLLDNAISKLNSANTKLSEAESYFSASKWSDTKSSANQAEYYANDALINAGNAKSTAIQSKEKYGSEEGKTKSKLDTAEKTYNNVVDTLDKTKEVVTLLSSIGIETSDFTKDLEEVSSTLKNAKAELDKATKRYEDKELSGSREYAAKSLDLTERDITILKETQNKMFLAAMDKYTTKYSSINNNYEIAVKALEESKTKITASDYITKKEKLDNAKKSLDSAINLMNQAKLLADNKEYSDAIMSFKDAVSELEKAEALLTPPQTPGFQLIYAIFVITLIAILLRKMSRGDSK